MGGGSGRRGRARSGREREAESGQRGIGVMECELRARATSLNLIARPHAQFSRHKGSARMGSLCGGGGNQSLQFLRKH